MNVNVSGTQRELRHEITRDNTMSQQQLDAWRLFVTAQPGSEQMPAGDSQIVEAIAVPDSSENPGGDTQVGTDDDLTIVEE